MRCYIPLHSRYEARLAKYRAFLSETGATDIEMANMEGDARLNTPQVLCFDADARCLRRLRSPIYTCFFGIIFFAIYW